MTEELIEWLKSHEFDKPDVFEKIRGIYNIMKVVRVTVIDRGSV